jgi:hypothetical protein
VRAQRDRRTRERATQRATPSSWRVVVYIVYISCDSGGPCRPSAYDQVIYHVLQLAVHRQRRVHAMMGGCAWGHCSVHALPSIPQRGGSHHSPLHCMCPPMRHAGAISTRGALFSCRVLVARDHAQRPRNLLDVLRLDRRRGVHLHIRGREGKQERRLSMRMREGNSAWAHGCMGVSVHHLVEIERLLRDNGAGGVLSGAAVVSACEPLRGRARNESRDGGATPPLSSKSSEPSACTHRSSGWCTRAAGRRPG